MSSGQKTILTWAAIILLIAYLGNINLALLISNIIHAAQYVHQSSGGH